MPLDQLISLATTKDTLERLNKIKVVLNDYQTLSSTLPLEQDAKTLELGQAIHKLKSPISAINGYMDLMKMSGPDLESVKSQTWLAKLEAATADLNQQLQLVQELNH